jgi:mRNA interferase MazF
MANGTYLRGEVYWVSLDDSLGSEIKTGRPAVVVSANGLNEKFNTVIVAFLTTGSYPAPSHPTVVSPEGVRSRVLCEQIRAIDKSRLVRYDFTLAEPELIRITGAIANTMCIPLPQAVNTKYDEKIADLEAEITVLKRLYDKAIDKIVETRLEADVSRRMEIENEPEYPIEEEITEEVPELPVVEFYETPELVDINICSAEDLKKCGCSLSMANALISNRPYKTLDEIRGVPGITSVAYGLLKVKLCCIPVVEEEPEVVEVSQPEPEPELTEKININTATARELMDKLGINYNYAFLITGYRNKNGRYVALEELKEVHKLPKVFYERYKDRLTIGEDAAPVETEQPPEPEEVELVDINSIKAAELHKKLGVSLSTCYCITKYRNDNGPYKKLEDILNAKQVYPGTLDKLRGRITFGDVTEEAPETKQPEQPTEEKKVNINTASLRDLMAVGFEKRAAALIVNERRKFGHFRDVEDLSEIPEISGKILRKLRDKLEV